MNNLLFLNIGTAEMILLIVTSLIYLVPLSLAVISLIDLFKRNFEDKTSEKVVMIILILLAPIIGSALYLGSLRKNYKLKDQYEKVRV